jgi:arginyl-tRNA synthetase
MQLRQSVIELLVDLLGEAAGSPAELDQALTVPPRPEMGDLAFPCFPLAKALRKAPPTIAQELAAKAAALLPRGPIARIEAAGPYLNVFSAPERVLAGLLEELADGSFFASARTDAPAKVMIEHSQPNTHKVFHVGHLRNVALGDCLVRVFRERGHDVVAANYYGDFGIDVAKCLWWLTTHPGDRAPETGRGAWLGEAYKAATAALEEAKEQGDEKVPKAVRAVLDGIGGADPELRALYEETRGWCLEEFADVYRWLGVRFDVDFYESELEEAGQRIVDEYLEQGVFEPSQGAIICDLEEEKLGAALVRKSDGTSLYLTWDLVLAREKFDRFHIERSIYVVGSEQSLHFRQLFATLARMGYERAKDCRHVAYELVMLPEGKMSSRRGTAIPFHVLRGEVEQSIEAKMQGEDRPARAEWDETRWNEVVRRIAVASLRYGMLRVSNTTRVIFDVDAWTNPEGDSGAYLLYGLARISGIFRKGGRPAVSELAQAIETADASAFGAEAERRLLNHLLAYPRMLADVERDCDPSRLATYLFEGVKEFSRFYHECPVLKAEPGLKEARLGLVAAAGQVLTRCLELLGAEPVEEM